MANETSLIDRLEAMDREIDAWRKITAEQLIRRLGNLGLKERQRLGDEVALRKSVGSKISRKNLEIERVAFTFARHGIFLEHGVGKGRPVGSSQANKYRKPWLSIVLPRSVDELANILAEEYADITAEELRFLIPGVVDVTVNVRK